MTVLYVESLKFLVYCSFSNTGPKVNEIKYRIFEATYVSSYAPCRKNLFCQHWPVIFKRLPNVVF